MKRHASDLVSLIFGLIFLLAASWWLAVYYLDLNLDWNVPNLGWFLAGGLILLGLIGTVASLRRDDRDAAATGGGATPDDAAATQTAPQLAARTEQTEPTTTMTDMDTPAED